MTTVSFFVNTIGVTPSVNGLTNAIKYVQWYAVYELDGEKSVVPGEAFLDDPAPENFLPIETVSDQQAIDWAIASHGGQPFLDEMMAFQTMHLEQLKLKKSVVRWETPLLDPKPWVGTSANQISTTVI